MRHPGAVADPGQTVGGVAVAEPIWRPRGESGGCTRVVEPVSIKLLARGDGVSGLGEWTEPSGEAFTQGDVATAAGFGFWPHPR